MTEKNLQTFERLSCYALDSLGIISLGDVLCLHVRRHLITLYRPCCKKQKAGTRQPTGPIREVKPFECICFLPDLCRYYPG